MALQRIGWENGTLVEPAKMLSDGTVQPAQYEGTTPLSADNLKKMENNTEDFVNEQVGDLNSLNTTDKSSLVNAINSMFPENVIVETGSNSNGIWRKYANGDMECWFTQTVEKAINVAWGSN